MDPIADACVASLRAHGVDTRHLVRTPHGRLGLYFVEAGVNQRPGQVIYDRAGASFAITPAEAYDWPGIFTGTDWFVLSGITPALSRTAAAVARTAGEEAARHGVKVACDLNYRSKLWQWELSRPPRELATRTLLELMPWVDLLIGGLEDAEALLPPRPGGSPDEVARRIVEAFPWVRRVALTLRRGRSASSSDFGGLLDDATTGVAHQAPEGRRYSIPRVVDRLGAGDAFTAALVFALMTPELAAPAPAIGFAAAAGCLAHSIEGDFNLSTRAEIEALMREENGGRISR